MSSLITNTAASSAPEPRSQARGGEATEAPLEADVFTNLYLARLDLDAEAPVGPALPGGASLPNGGQTLPHDLTSEPLSVEDEALRMELAPEILMAWGAMQEGTRTARADTPSMRGEPLPMVFGRAHALLQTGASAIGQATQLPAEDFADPVWLRQDGLLPPASQSGTVSTPSVATALAAQIQLLQSRQNGQSIEDGQGGSLRASPMTAAEPNAQGQPANGGLPSLSLLNGPERALPALQIGTPLSQQAQWGEEVGNRIRWLVGNGLQSAELKMNPPQLGPIEVRVSIHKDQMSVTFHSSHAVVREALEEAAPRLREMMQGQGFASVDVDVSGQRTTGDDRQAPDYRGPALAATDSEESVTSIISGIDARGIIDFYA